MAPGYSNILKRDVHRLGKLISVAWRFRFCVRLGQQGQRMKDNVVVEEEQGVTKYQIGSKFCTLGAHLNFTFDARRQVHFWRPSILFLKIEG